MESQPRKEYLEPCIDQVHWGYVSTTIWPFSIPPYRQLYSESHLLYPPTYTTTSSFSLTSLLNLLVSLCLSLRRRSIVPSPKIQETPICATRTVLVYLLCRRGKVSASIATPLPPLRLCGQAMLGHAMLSLLTLALNDFLASSWPLSHATMLFAGR